MHDDPMAMGRSVTLAIIADDTKRRPPNSISKTYLLHWTQFGLTGRRPAVSLTVSNNQVSRMPTM